MIVIAKIEKQYSDIMVVLDSIEDAKGLLDIMERASVVEWDWQGKCYRDRPKESIPFSISLAPGEVMVARVEPMPEPEEEPLPGVAKPKGDDEPNMEF
jgi:hypothetical protein